MNRIVRSNNTVSLHVIYIDYLARVTGGKLKVGSDIGEAIWVEKKRIPQIWNELHDDTKRLLQIAGVIDASSAQVLNLEPGHTGVNHQNVYF